jgi:uncharacterized protein (TIGR03437 family)
MLTILRSGSCLLTFLITLALGAGTLQGATAIAATRVYTDPAATSFLVDGQRFSGAATFLWPQGSKHTLDIDPVQHDPLIKARFLFTGWSDSTGLLSVAGTHLVVTADPSITFYKAAVTLQYAVSLNFFSCPSLDLTACGSPGAVFVNNAAYLVNTDVYFDAGSTITLMAVPNPGYVFTGWLQGSGNTTQAYLNSFSLNGPVTVYPQFLHAGAVTIATNQPELRVLADRTQVFSPVTLDWGVGTTHTVGVATPQTDLHGRLWVFDSWSDGGAATHAYVMPSQAAVALTAKFVPGGRATFLTNPGGLALNIDGRSDWQTYNFVWAAGVPHTLSAPQQVDAAGNGWVFKSWSNGGAATQVIVPSSADIAAGIRLTANFTPSSQTTAQTVIQTSPAGLHLLVDGADCVTPCTFDRTIGSFIHVSAPGILQPADGVRVQFTAWADGGAGDRTITVASTTQTFTANYQSFYRLACTADPPSVVTWHLLPASTDGYYPAQTAVAISVDMAHGYIFDDWTGDASGAAQAITATMDRPHNIRAQIHRVSSDGIDAVRNAAGETPEAAVAPGSIVSIYGPKLAPATEIGPDSPLAQTLGSLTVTIGERMLPLFFVSPGQINAQLPSDLAAGGQTLVVHAEGQPDAAGLFTVQRNAPGLFYQQVGGKAYLVALHPDGSLVTPKSPARRGERITALGTGFGPYQVQPLDGFAVPNSASGKLADHAQLIFEGKIIEPEFAGAATGLVGVVAIRFRIADPLPVAATIEIKARVNGHDSNTVLLPLE